MRKILAAVLLITFLIIAPQNAPTVYAETFPPYVRAVTNDVYIYATPTNAKPMFKLEQSYYARVKGIEGSYYCVEIGENVGMFNKITGYVPISSVDAVYETPLTPLYPTVTVSVSTDSAKVFLYPETTSSVLVRAANTQTMAYYGSLITNGTVWYYVCCSDYMGYVDSKAVTKAAVALHPTPLPQVVVVPEEPTKPVITDPVDDPITDTEKTPTQSFDGIQLALILLIALPSVVIVFMLFSPTKKSDKHDKQNYKSVATTSRTPEEKRAKPRYFDDYL